MPFSPSRAKTIAQFLYHQRIKGFAVSARLYFAGAEDAFRQRLMRSHSYLEYGSGSSTIAAAEARIPTVSVEGDRFFARAVRRAIPAGAPVRFATPDIGFTVELSRPLFKTPTARRMRRWARYVQAPYALIERFPDFILVDGRFRAACALEAARRARDGGHVVTIMFDDYVNRPRYHGVEQHLGTPIIVGRAAFFEVGRDQGGAPITPEIVHAALADWF